MFHCSAVSEPACLVRGSLASVDKSTVYVKTGKSFRILCSAEYRGNCEPRTSCQTEDKSVIFNGSDHTSPDPGKVRTYSSIFTIYSNRLSEGDRISCGMKFPCLMTKEGTDVYHSNWLSPTINVSGSLQTTINNNLLYGPIMQIYRACIVQTQCMQHIDSASMQLRACSAYTYVHCTGHNAYNIPSLQCMYTRPAVHIYKACRAYI